MEQINLFAYLKFKISGGYIIIENESYDLQNVKRIITRDIVENLKLLEYIKYMHLINNHL